jgi:Zn-dependent protease
MLRSWKIATAFGIGIYIHWSFLIVPAIVFAVTRKEGFETAVLSAIAVVLLFGCIVLHELGHALTARHYGIPTRDITLTPIGGIARLERMTEQPWEELWIALAGPAVNVVIAVLLFAVFVPTYLLLGAPKEDWPFGLQLLGAVMLLNIGVVFFNMLPAFPMDGGRVLRAVLSMNMDRLRATEIAARIGMVLALLIALLGLIQLNPLPALVGLFVIFVGRQELAALRYRASREWPTSVSVQRADSYTAPGPLLPPEPNFSGFTWDRRGGVWVQWREGRPVHTCWVASD